MPRNWPAFRLLITLLSMAALVGEILVRDTVGAIFTVCGLYLVAYWKGE